MSQLTKSKYVDHTHLRTGLLPTKMQTMQQALGQSRRGSSSLVTDFFGEIHSPRKINRVQRDKQGDAEMFDISATVMETYVPSSDMELQEQSRKVSDSIWEDLRCSIDILDQENESKDADCEIVGQNIKAESIDVTSKPSCQFQKTVQNDFDGVTIKVEPIETSSCLMHTTPCDNLNSRPKTLPIPVSQQVILSQPGSSIVQYITQMNSVGMNKSQVTTTNNRAYLNASTPPHMVPVLLPPTPPNSQPGSPSQDQVRRTPPPPYPGLHRPSPPMTTNHVTELFNVKPIIPIQPTHDHNRHRSNKIQITHPGCSTIKYNRKNNPELEKRRIHFCDFPSKYSVCFPLHTFVKKV